VTADGRWHTVHVYGADGSGNSVANLYVPSGFTAKYEGGPNNQVVATNKKSGQQIVYAHVHGITSQRELDRNLGTENKAGSRLIGKIGGPGGDNKGYIHAHVSIYKNAAGRQTFRDQMYGSNNGLNLNQNVWSDFRKLIR
jgi:hypothetical protein